MPHSTARCARSLWVAAICTWMCLPAGLTANAVAQQGNGPDQRAADRPVFQAGAAMSNITPPLGEPIVGGFEPRPARHVHDELHARCLVLDDGKSRLAIVLCDNVGIPREVYDAARQDIERETKLPGERILMAATHTHSATSARTENRLVTSRELNEYQRFLARRIADGVVRAINNLEPARIGWGRVDVPEEVFNRRWHMTPGPHLRNPFGGVDQVRMNPPATDPGLLRPAGPVDPQVCFLSVQSRDGRPLALVANYSLHYVGGTGPNEISADYFAMFADRIQELLGADRLDPPFVGILSNGTSGDVNNIDFTTKRGRRAPYEKMREVANRVAAAVHAAHEKIEFRDHAPLDARLTELKLGVRRPTEDQLAWARETLDKPADAPVWHGREKHYARRVLVQSESPEEVSVPIQAVRIGDVGIAAIPFEVFTEIGLEIKEQAPFELAFTIELANGSYGYLPTPAQHKLGGYETWLGTNLVEIEASTKIVETVAGLFAELANDQPAELHGLSLPLKTLERDLDSRDYHDVLPTMIHTDLAAEWQRVATPDNYHVFAGRQGGVEKVVGDPQLKEAYERRKAIADRFLALMRAEYAQRKLKPPFDDADLLKRTLEDADRKAADSGFQEIPVRALLPAPGAEQHWPAFRGPTGQGIVFDTRLPSRWSATENVLWKTPLPGRGNSSPVIWGDRLFVTAEGPPAATQAAGAGGAGGAEAAGGASAAAPERLLLCFDRRDGRQLWQHAAPAAAQPEKLYWKNSYASSTPVTDGERVIAFFGNSGLVCCDLDGQRLWHQDLGTFPTTHGPGTTPVLYQDLVIIIQDQNRGASLCAAFDKHTGEKRWQRERPNNMGWSTPVLLRVGDRDELVYNGSNEVVGYDPATGDELWKLAGPSIEAIPMIVSGGGLLYSTSGRNGPTLAIRPGGEGDVTATHLVWRSQRGGPHVPSPAWHDGRLYLVSDTGIVTCLAAASGEALWQRRLRGRFSASPLVIGETLLLLNENGVSYLLRSGPEFEVIGEFDLGETTLATPAILDGRIYFRTEGHVLCVGES